MEEEQVSLVHNFILFNENHNSLTCIDHLQILLVDPYDIGHERFLSGFDEMRGKIGDIHVAPFEGQNHPHESLND
jgi:hypothetical protein